MSPTGRGSASTTRTRPRGRTRRPTPGSSRAHRSAARSMCIVSSRTTRVAAAPSNVAAPHHAPRTTARTSARSVNHSISVRPCRRAAPTALPMPPTANAPKAARMTDVCRSPALVTADSTAATAPQVPATVAAYGPSSSTGSAATQRADHATTRMTIAVAPSGTSSTDVPSRSSPDPCATSQPCTAVRSSPVTDEPTPPWASMARAPLRAIPSTIARAAVRKAGRR